MIVEHRLFSIKMKNTSCRVLLSCASLEALKLIPNVGSNFCQNFCVRLRGRENVFWSLCPNVFWCMCHVLWHIYVCWYVLIYIYVLMQADGRQRHTHTSCHSRRGLSSSLLLKDLVLVLSMLLALFHAHALGQWESRKKSAWPCSYRLNKASKEPQPSFNRALIEP
jgi:hypothetical protein